MKNVIYSIFTVVLCLNFASCDKIAERSNLYKKKKLEADSLAINAQNKEEELLEISKMVDDIVLGLDNLKQEEKALLIESGEVSLDASAKERVGENMKSILLSIERYKEQIDKLEAKVKSQPAAFRATIARLKTELEEKDKTIADISGQIGIKNEELNSMKKQVRSLMDENKNLNLKIDSINGKITEQQEAIEKQENLLYAAYFTIGTQAELTKSGILVKKKVNTNLNVKDFTKIDIRSKKLINLKTTSKVKVYSSHPEKSYSIATDKTGNKVLKIKNVTEFWKQSRYLVIVK